MNWQLEREHAEWSSRDSMGHAVFKDRMWVLGGWRPRQPRANDVWCSEDGRKWELVTPSAPWEPRNLCGTVVHDGRLWLFGGGGNDSPTPHCDVWCSEDGETWEKVLDGAPWGKRGMHASVVFQDQIWLLGGGLYHSQSVLHNDVWRSPDGVTWEAAAHNAGWTPRIFHVSVVADDRIWLASGHTRWGHQPDKVADLNDVWVSGNGADWEIVTRASVVKNCEYTPVEDNSWEPRHAPGMLFFKGKLWIFGGGQREWNDVWSLDPLRAPGR